MKVLIILSSFLLSINSFSQMEADTCGFYVNAEIIVDDPAGLTVWSNCPLSDFKFVLHDSAGQLQYESTEHTTPMSLDSGEKISAGGIEENKYKKGETYSWIIYYRLPSDSDAGMRMVNGTLVFI
jgi:hypothetical protein